MSQTALFLLCLQVRFGPSLDTLSADISGSDATVISTLALDVPDAEDFDGEVFVAEVRRGTRPGDAEERQDMDQAWICCPS